MTTFTAEEKLSCAKRELNMRRRVYPRWIETGKLTQEKASWEIACMEEMVRDYEELTKKERLL